MGLIPRLQRLILYYGIPGPAGRAVDCAPLVL